MKQHIFKITQPIKRLDKYLVDNLDLTRSMIDKLFKGEHISVNNEIVTKAGSKVQEGTIEVNIPDPKELDLQAQDIPLEFIYQDEHIAVVNKPAGMATHPGPGVFDNTLVNALLFHIKDLSDIGGTVRPGIVHRLDKDTSGLIVIAKNDKAHQKMSAIFKDRAIDKTYLAIVKGFIAIKQGIIETLIGRDKHNRKKMSSKVTVGKKAISKYKVIKEMESTSLVEVKIETGRTHQIRMHMAYLNHPIVGDALYGRGEAGKRQMLHAYKLSFKHPITNAEMNFEAPIPADFIVD